MNRKLQVLWLLSLLVVVAHGKYSSQGQRVCIIGAGVSGLISSDKLSSSPNEFEIIVFEKSSDIGGQWLYTDRTDVDEHGLPVSSNIYKYMRANSPKPMQTFPDYVEFHGENRSYVMHETMLQYLKNFTEHFDLRRFMRFNTHVENVSSRPNNKWHFELRNLITNETYDMTCDAAIVGTGNFHKPNIPKISGIESFPGLVMHSKSYRVPEIFADQTVVVLGASFSGLDIGFQISDCAKKVYISHRHQKLEVEMPANTMDIPEVVEVDGSDLILSDGSKVQADSLLLCTGYLYDYPELDENTAINVVEGKYVRPLYKHLINAEHPTMAIFGLPHRGFPFLIPYAQAEYFVAVLEGKVKLPSREEMLRGSELPEGVPPSRAHYMSPNQSLPYYDELALAAGSKPMPDGLKNFFRYWWAEVAADPLHYKDKDVYVHDDGTFEVVDRPQ